MRRIVIASGLGAVLAVPGQAQYPRLAPPPQCRVEPASAQPLLALWNADRAPRSRPRLAVFPLQPEIDDPARVHVAISLPDRVRQRLSTVSQIEVASEGTVSRAMLIARDLPDSAASILKADYLLTGRIVVTGGRQELQILLRRQGTADPIWQAPFRSTVSLRAMENAIVSGVSRVLLEGRTPAPPAGWPSSDEAYASIVAGDTYLRSTTLAGADSAATAYERAVELAPTSPVAASRLAKAYVTMLQRGGEVRGLPGVSGTNRIFGLTTQALALDSASAEAWTVRATLARVLDPVRFEGATQAHRRAIALSPSDAEAAHEFGVTLMRLGDARAAETQFRRAIALETSRAGTLAALGEMELRAERWETACAFSNASIAAWPFDPLAYAVRAEARLRRSEARDAYADAEMVRRLTTGAWTSALRVIVADGAGNVDEARRQARELTGAWLATGVPLSVRDGEYLARAYLAVGDERRAIESLRRAQPVGADLGVALRGAGLGSIRSDTAVVRLLRESAEGRTP